MIKTRLNTSRLQSYPHVCEHVCKYETLSYERVAIELQLLTPSRYRHILKALSYFFTLFNKHNLNHCNLLPTFTQQQGVNKDSK